MQFQCRRAKMLNNSKNKGEYDDLVEIWQVKKCAVSDAVAQLKVEWRSLCGAVGARVSDPQQCPNLPRRHN
jgi:hypothetical protein